MSFVGIWLGFIVLDGATYLLLVTRESALAKVSRDNKVKGKMKKVNPLNPPVGGWAPPNSLRSRSEIFLRSALEFFEFLTSAAAILQYVGEGARDLNLNKTRRTVPPTGLFNHCMNALTPTDMTLEQKQLVQNTWEKILPISDSAATLFYDRLFELDLSTRPLFKHTNMQEQRKKLMQVIGTAVNGLNRLDQLIPAVRNLGRRHTGYGVTDEHYSSVGRALIWTLE